MSNYAKIADALRFTASAIPDHKLEVLSLRTLNDGATAIEELTAQVRDKDYLIQQQTDEIERLRRDVKKQQEKMIELAKGLYKTGVFTVDGREIMKGDKVKGLFLYAQPVTGTVIFRDGSFGVEWDRGGTNEFTPFTSTCNVRWEVQE